MERVQNRTLFEQYSAMKEFIETQSQGSSVPLERQLWHTVDIEDISEVNSSGFNRNKCSRKCKTLLNYQVNFNTNLMIEFTIYVYTCTSISKITVVYEHNEIILKTITLFSKSVEHVKWT